MTDDERLNAIKARLAAINGFSYTTRDQSAWQAHTLTELDAAGAPLHWERPAFSEQACRFFVAAPSDERYLIDRLEAAERENRLLRQMVEGK